MGSDEELALDFLAGRTEESEGRVSHKYLEPDGDEENAARAALLRLLRSHQPLSGMLRWRLAALLDPEHTLEERKFLIQNRQPGKQNEEKRSDHSQSAVRQTFSLSSCEL